MQYMEPIPMKKILFTSGKGGVGKSTLAAAFAKTLHDEGSHVLLIDFDISLRTLDLMLGLGDLVLYDWGDVIRGNCSPHDAVIHNSEGPDLLPAPLSFPNASEEQIRDLLDAYTDHYDYILLDSPAGVGRGFEAASCTADLALVVSTPDRICVRSASVAADRLAERGIPARLIINRFNKHAIGSGRSLNIDDVIDSTGLQLIGIIPEDENLVQSAQTGAELEESGKGARAVSRILGRLQGEDIPLKV